MRLADAQRCPAFEKADASTHSTAGSRSASSQTTSAFLPPSSRHVFASRRAAAALIERPVAAEPVKLTRPTSGWSTSAAPASEPSPCTTLSTPGATPASSASSAKNDADAGVCSDGFTTAAFPQKIAGNAFHATFGSGVLKLMISAATPSGWRIVSTVRLAMLAVVVRPYERRPSPAMKRPISTAASASPRASARDFPVSSATIAAASSRLARRRSASSRTMSPRATAVRSAQAGCAARAAATASATSSASERATRQSTVSSAGRIFSSQAPERAGTARPSMRFVTSDRPTKPTSRRRRRRSSP